jgi:hypothetical protein
MHPTIGAARTSSEIAVERAAVAAQVDGVV